MLEFYPMPTNLNPVGGGLYSLQQNHGGARFLDNPSHAGVGNTLHLANSNSNGNSNLPTSISGNNSPTMATASLTGQQQQQQHHHQQHQLHHAASATPVPINSCPTPTGHSPGHSPLSTSTSSSNNNNSNLNSACNTLTAAAVAAAAAAAASGAAAGSAGTAPSSATAPAVATSQLGGAVAAAIAAAAASASAATTATPAPTAATGSENSNVHGNGGSNGCGAAAAASKLSADCSGRTGMFQKYFAPAVEAFTGSFRLWGFHAFRFWHSCVCPACGPELPEFTSVLLRSPFRWAILRCLSPPGRGSQQHQGYVCSLRAMFLGFLGLKECFSSGKYMFP